LDWKFSFLGFEDWFGGFYEGSFFHQSSPFEGWGALNPPLWGKGIGGLGVLGRVFPQFPLEIFPGERGFSTRGFWGEVGPSEVKKTPPP